MPHTNAKTEKTKGDYTRKADFTRKAFGEKKGGKGNRRQNKEQRKKGQSKWKNVHAEIEGLNTRILQETPPSGVLYYKYRPGKNKEDEDVKGEAMKDALTTTNKRHPVLETSDKQKIKIRFSDLPLSKCT